MVVLGRMVCCGWLGSGTLQADADTLQSASSPRSLCKVFETGGLSSRGGAGMLVEMCLCNVGAGCTVLDAAFRIVQISLQCLHSVVVVVVVVVIAAVAAVTVAVAVAAAVAAAAVVFGGYPQPDLVVIHNRICWKPFRDGVNNMGMPRAGRRSVGSSGGFGTGIKTDGTAAGRVIPSGHHSTTCSNQQHGI